MQAKIKSYHSDLCFQTHKGGFLGKFPDFKHTQAVVLFFTTQGSEVIEF